MRSCSKVAGRLCFGMPRRPFPHYAACPRLSRGGMAILPPPPRSRMTNSPDLYRLPGFHDPFSSLTHLLGAGAFLFLGMFLIQRVGGNRARVFFLSVYVFTCVFLLSMSGVYHMLERGGTAREVLARLDHGAIFLLIAGTFTPAHGILFRGWLRWGALLLVWSAAVTGVTLKTVFFEDVAEWLGLALYLALAWMGGVSMVLLARRYGFAFIRPLLLGGLAYTAGGVTDFLGWPVAVPGFVHPHEVFHMAILVGVFLHWRFTWQIAGGEVARRLTSGPRPTGRACPRCAAAPH